MNNLVVLWSIKTTYTYHFGTLNIPWDAYCLKCQHIFITLLFLFFNTDSETSNLHSISNILFNSVYVGCFCLLLAMNSSC